MKQLKAIGVSSVFKVSLVLGATAGLVVGVVFLIFDFADHRLLEGVITLILAPILYGLLGAVVNAAMAWLYNVWAERRGGIEIDLE